MFYWRGRSIWMKRARKVDYHLNCRDEWNLHTSLPVSVKHLCGMEEEWLTGRCVLLSVVSLVYPCTSSASLLDGWVLTKWMDGMGWALREKSYDEDFYYVRCRIICRDSYWEFRWKDICLSPSHCSHLIMSLTRCSLPGKFKLPAR